MSIFGVSPKTPFRVLCAASLVSASLGTVHGFSIFLDPLEMTFGVGRNAVSLGYSLALVCITIAVLFGHRFYHKLPGSLLIAFVAGAAAAGLGIAAMGQSILGVWLGYGVIFGLANGMGYGFSLQFAARANPDHSGLAMGVVTAAYALGAVVAPIGFAFALALGGFTMAMWGLAVCILALCGVAACIVHASGFQYAHNKERIAATAQSLDIGLWWLGYGAAVFAGLMVIGHAQGIVTAAGYQGAAWHAIALISASNLVGSLIGGQATDKLHPILPICLLPALSLVGAFALVTGFALLAPIALVGFAYGGIIAAYPAAISQAFGAEKGPVVYGKVFTAWGAAGLAGPWIAGYLFDMQASYDAALWIAALLSLLSIVFALLRHSKN